MTVSYPLFDSLRLNGLPADHVASMCSPTRSMIMSGTDAHMAGVGVMCEFAEGNRERWNRPGHEGYLSEPTLLSLC